MMRTLSTHELLEAAGFPPRFVPYSVTNHALRRMVDRGVLYPSTMTRRGSGIPWEFEPDEVRAARLWAVARGIVAPWDHPGPAAAGAPDRIVHAWRDAGCPRHGWLTASEDRSGWTTHLEMITELDAFVAVNVRRALERLDDPAWVA